MEKQQRTQQKRIRVNRSKKSRGRRKGASSSEKQSSDADLTITWRSYKLPTIIEGKNITVKLQMGGTQFRLECNTCNQMSFVPFQNKKWIFDDGTLECPKCGKTSVNLFAASK
ncbi:hypothetical protein KKH43_05745 [Patescibacteria group bacterium]|nr:hypothetical protein [Patescibacteria group bacterium]